MVEKIEILEKQNKEEFLIEECLEFSLKELQITIPSNYIVALYGGSKFFSILPISILQTIKPENIHMVLHVEHKMLKSEEIQLLLFADKWLNAIKVSDLKIEETIQVNTEHLFLPTKAWIRPNDNLLLINENQAIASCAYDFPIFKNYRLNFYRTV